MEQAQLQRAGMDRLKHSYLGYVYQQRRGRKDGEEQEGRSMRVRHRRSLKNGSDSRRSQKRKEARASRGNR
ncbi:uncharacterized protein BDW70DRAFT_37101 [Aspergillus foveolatus]|uniref:uncharacterized protein n=1 Tax=Aspergillus foveolatus TaxID=210207 RepID=UPI003CCCE6CC